MVHDFLGHAQVELNVYGFIEPMDVGKVWELLLFVDELFNLGVDLGDPTGFNLDPLVALSLQAGVQLL